MPSAHPVPKHGRLAWIAPRPFDWVALFLYFTAFTLFLLRQMPHFAFEPAAWVRIFGMAATIGGLLLVDRWEFQRYHSATPRSVAFPLLVVRIALVELAIQIDGLGLSVFLYSLPPFTAALAFGNRVGWSLAAVLWMFFLSKLTWIKPGWPSEPDLVNNVMVFTLLLIFFQAMATVIGTERTSRQRTERLLADLEDSHAQLAAYATHVAQLATTTERNRLAREIHDSLGHYLTVINVQLEKALAFRSRDPAQADAAVYDAKQVARAALDDVRRSVGILRSDEPLVLAQALRELAASLQREHAVVVQVCGDQAGFARTALEALFRGAQEGLTNIQRHAQASTITLTLTFTPLQATLTLTDDGIGFAPDTLGQLPGHGGQYGLQGLRERFEALGGQVALFSRPGAGTTLTLCVPKQPQLPPGGNRER